MPPGYDEIINGRLWVGSFVRAEDIGEIASLGITTLITLQSQDDLINYSIRLDAVLDACSRHNIRVRHLPVADFDKAALALNLDRCVAALASALAEPRARVYLHCTAGINRAPTVAAAFLIRHFRMTALEAFAFLTSRRRCQPFLSVLQDYQEALPSSSQDSAARTDPDPQ